jgi:hypothetical protein
LLLFGVVAAGEGVGGFDGLDVEGGKDLACLWLLIDGQDEPVPDGRQLLGQGAPWRVAAQTSRRPRFAAPALTRRGKQTFEIGEVKKGRLTPRPVLPTQSFCRRLPALMQNI